MLYFPIPPPTTSSFQCSQAQLYFPVQQTDSGMLYASCFLPNRAWLFSFLEQKSFLALHSVPQTFLFDNIKTAALSAKKDNYCSQYGARQYVSGPSDMPLLHPRYLLDQKQYICIHTSAASKLIGTAKWDYHLSHPKPPPHCSSQISNRGIHLKAPLPGMLYTIVDIELF